MRRSSVLWLSACVLSAAPACASSAALRPVQQIESVERRAAQQGASRCAPEELALSRVHLEFARMELAQGNPRRAQQHIVLAEPNARAALRVTSSKRCRRGELTFMSPSRPLAAVGGARHAVRGTP